MCSQKHPVWVLILKSKTDTAETNTYKVPRGCRLSDAEGKGNKNELGISLFLYGHLQCKEGLVELQAVYAKYFIKMCKTFGEPEWFFYYLHAKKETLNVISLLLLF